jgi:hypothetical protein
MYFTAKSMNTRTRNNSLIYFPSTLPILDSAPRGAGDAAAGVKASVEKY